jgi:hypothetical protein
MIINQAVNLYNNLLILVERDINLWRVEQAMESLSYKIVPSSVSINVIKNHIKEMGLGESILGIDTQNTDFIHALAMWVVSGRTLKIADQVVPMVLDINILDYLDPKILYNFPCQSIYIDNQIGLFDGAIICKDYVEEQGYNQYMLNITLVKNKGNGKHFCLILPPKNNDKFLDSVKLLPEWNVIESFFKIFLYILNGYTNKDDLISQKGRDYFGFNLADAIEQNKGKQGHWRKGHWHSYFVKDNGIEKLEMKLIQPTWVNG